MGTKSRENIYGASVRASAERAAEARRDADKLACVAWNDRMLGFQGPAQPSPTLGDALNGGYPYLEVKCLGCETHQTVALNIIRRPKNTPVHELERYMRCKDCSRQNGRPFKRSHLVALRSTKISAFNPPSTWWPGERRRGIYFEIRRCPPLLGPGSRRALTDRARQGGRGRPGQPDPYRAALRADVVRFQGDAGEIQRRPQV